ncbi:hypothetical protein [Methanococcus maripaludis]|uniref:Uncharacterized protein n=1 Tax=Methanococcus maripaludis TaxID=39152 RepID=A0A7J9PLD1_METMI|nr:hypothetical protein [Methanococcus maripaludis]MBA2864025.1 hypothetical protein [Methanococcus maripaludis]
MEFQTKDVKRSFRTFKDYSFDILNSTHRSFKFNLDKFIKHCNNDPIMNNILNPLIVENEYLELDYSEFMAPVGNGHHIILPEDENRRLSVIYYVLIQLKDGNIKILKISQNLFNRQTGTLDYIIEPFLKQIFYQFSRDICNKLNDFLDDHAKEEKISEDKLCIFKDCTFNVNNSRNIVIEINSNEELKNSLEKIAEELKNSNKNQEAINAVIELSKLTESNDVGKIEETINKAIKNENSLKSRLNGLFLNVGSSLAGSVFLEVAKSMLGMS